jgi:uncharacterized protein
LISVRVLPRSRAGLRLEEDVVVIAVAAPALEGRATEAARRALAEALGLPPSRVTLHAGPRSRHKVFLAAGLEPEEVRRRLGVQGA